MALVLTRASIPGWLTVYFLFSLGLTLHNKFVLLYFPFPWLLTAAHTLASTIGCLFLSHIGFFKPQKLTLKENMSMIAFSLLYTVNIAVSNVSLAMVTVPVL
jgi:hypothetical protein